MSNTQLQIANRLKALLYDETGGERDIVTTMIILGSIVVPIILLLAAFGQQIVDFAQQAINSVLNALVG